MKNSKILFFLSILSISISCKKEVIKVDENNQSESTIKYAKGFDIVDENGVKKLIIKSAYQNSDEIFEYIIQNKSDQKEEIENTLFTPIQKIVVTSTTHIPMVELLNEETAIVGFPYAKYVSSAKTRALIDEGKIQEIGKESSLNTEILLDLQPELVVGYSVSSADKSLTPYNAPISLLFTMEIGPRKLLWVKQNGLNFLEFCLIKKNKQIVFLK